jgi:hypothetical protein
MDKNTVVNDLAWQASGFQSNKGKFGFLEKLDVPVFQTRLSSFRPMHRATICSTEPSSAKLEGPELPLLRMNQAKSDGQS